MEQHPLPQRKHIRLDLHLYAELGSICSITISTLGRRPIFQNGEFARACVDLLTTLAGRSSVQIYVYCFMPDHVHLLSSPSGKKSIIDFVREFKALSTRVAWQHGYQGKIWQESFYDHFLRRDDDVEVAVNYILNNPVRKTMVEEWMAYPYSGSLVYEL